MIFIINYYITYSRSKWQWF